MGIGAYVAYGLLPLYLKLLADVPAIQLLSHRVLWSVPLLISLAYFRGQLPAIRQAARGKTLALLILSAGLMTINWLMAIWAVLHGHVLATSLGYLISPLVSILLGLFLLKERVSRVQATALGIVIVGVLSLVATDSGEIWISLTLAASFGSYGLVRKIARIDALGGLVVETALLAPGALSYLAWVQANGVGSFGPDWSRDVLLIFAGVVTAAPLLMFTAAARRMPYSTLGLLQYISPTLQFVEAVFIFGEPLHMRTAVALSLIWVGCACYAGSIVIADRRRREHARQ